MQIGQHKEAAEYLLTALSMQQKNFSNGGNAAASIGQSTSIWNTLSQIVKSYLGRQDLLDACEQKNLEVFHQHFDFE